MQRRCKPTPVPTPTAIQQQPSPESTLSDLSTDNADLRDQLALRDLALDGIATTFVIADRTTAEPTIIYCNQAAAEMCGMPREDLIGRPISLISQHNVTIKPNYRKDHATLSAGKQIAYESEVKRSDGTTFWRGVTVVPIFNSAGCLIRSIATGADITVKREFTRRQQELQDQLVAELRERERILSELQLAQKLEAIGRLAAGIAHEINTPIQYIGDCIHFVKSGVADTDHLLSALLRLIADLPAGTHACSLQSETADLIAKHELEFLRMEIPKAFQRMTDGVDRVATIVRSMKDFAHPDTSEPGEEDINHGLQSTLTIARHVYKHIAQAHTEFSDLPHVTCHIGALNQVFLNLIVNSAHAIEDAGRTLDTGVIHIGTCLEGANVVIRVRDNGCGIPAENLEKVYDPFFTTKEVGRGTGQGLALARSIVVDQHGGTMSISSTVGAGTEFTLTLPVGGRGVTAA
jgi:PAS domain S-box-containing protein